MKVIRKARREHFGGIIYSEHPGFTAFIDNTYADQLGVSRLECLPSNIYSAPLDVHMSLTTKCNLMCKGCYSVNTSTPISELDFSLAKAILTNLSRLNVFTVSFGGGEPLLYPKVFDLGEFARGQNIAPNLTTNGRGIDRIVARQCKVFANMHVSLHSMNDLECLDTAVGHLRQAGIVPGLNLLLTTETLPYLQDIFGWAAKHKLTKILLLQFKITDKNQEHRHLQLSKEQNVGLFPTIRQLASKFKVIPLVDCSFFPLLAIHKPKQKELEFYDVNGCQGGNMYLAIDVHGRYKPCSFWPESMGEAESLSLQEWQESSKLKQFREAHGGKCDCHYFSLCNGGCRLFTRQVCFEEES